MSGIHDKGSDESIIRTILHVDMDAFYAAVEQRDRPELRGKALIVGSDPKGGKGRGIVATCSYEARKFGVHSAQPISQAWRLCPHGIYIQPDMAKYERASGQVMGILLGFSDLLEQISIDEAFLDVTGSRRLFGTGVEIARKVKSRIHEELQLTASVGVASNKFVAKVASDLQKPDGLVVVEPGREREFLAPLPISRLWGVGKKTEALLRGIGLERIGQLAALTRSELMARLGRGGEHLWLLAQGFDDRTVSPAEGYKSIGHEITFERDTADAAQLHDTLLELTERVCQRLRAHRARARTITIKFREADFSTYTRRTSLDTPVDTAEKAFPVASRLMSTLVRKDILVRLIGVYASNLETEAAGSQLRLFDRAPQRDRKLASALDDIVRRYGDGSITRAALVGPKKR
ncbi:MAG TPA: DNA polymerase IV [Acidobacteriota bacterium]|nr:DNA polymerase IV [Acidobacteriota bacterium]